MNQQPQLKTIVSRNNEGVAAFERGDLVMAMNELSEAFRMSKAAFQVAVPQPTSLPQHIDDDSFELLDHLFSHRHGENVKQYCDNDEASHSSTFVYQTAIYLPHIPALEAIGTTYSSIHLTILSVVLFNLALVYHMAGSHNLQKASKLYDLAFRLQRTEHGNPQSIVYLMVIMNNLGQIYRQLGHATAADHCFRQLLSMSFFVMNRRRALDTNLPEVSSMQSNLGYLLEGFFDSTCHLFLNNSSGPAPAA